ncbi:MAG: mannose-6-phosphate isomerase, class I [Bacteroidota bacterium]
MNASYTISALQGKVQHYEWGGFSYLPELLGINNEEKRPFAEYWLGVHPLGIAKVLKGNESVLLSDLIAADPATALSETVYKRFGELPYLLKILDVNQMLSIQVHPTKEVAEAGFEREDKMGIARNAYNRNYKDRNHKPEIMLAINEFWLLHGFKQQYLLEKTLAEIQEFQVLLPLFRKEGLASLYSFIMEMNQQSVNDLLLPLVKREIRKKKDGLLTKNDPGWWVAKYYQEENPVGNIDRGVFSIYLFNITRLQPGEAIFQGAGVPHAYLEGQNIELMSNSDNVLRGGLTGKHIDVPELLKNTRFESIVPKILKGKLLRDGEAVFYFPVPDFALGYLQLHEAALFEDKANGPETWMVLEGGVIINNEMVMKKGASFIVFPDQSYTFRTSGKTVLCKAFVPLDNAYSQYEEN